MLSTPLPCLKSYFIMIGVFPGRCINLKDGIQSLIDEGLLQFDRIVKDEKVEEKDVAVISIMYTPVNILVPARPILLTIVFPGPIPYSSKSVVPWHYESDVQEGRLSEDKPSEDASLNVDNFFGTGRITKSDRIYSPQHAQDNADALEKDKGKQVVSDNSESVQVNTPNVVPGTSSSQEVEESLRLIRKSDYKVIDHLSRHCLKFQYYPYYCVLKLIEMP